MPALLDLAPQAALEFELGALATFEGMIRQLHADQYRRIQRARELAAGIDGVTASSSARDRDLATRSFVAEIATMLGHHEATASRLVAEAERLTGPRAATFDALAAGELSLTQMRSVLELTQGLPTAVADAVERVALDAASGAAARGVASTNAELRRRMRQVRERIHPEPLADRRARAMAERRVSVEPAPDGMAWLGLFLEAERAIAIDHRLDVLAAREASGDPRTAAQRSADLAADLLLSGLLLDDDRTRDGVASATGAVQPRINVTVPVLTLLGLDDEPAHLEGYGPIDADTAHRLAAHAPSLRRILVHPETGAALSYGRAHYRAPADLEGFVRVRDGRCRFPGCSRRADRADLDHTTAWERGGHTAEANLAALCRRHHRLKHESGWRVVQEPGGVMRWTSPAGHVLRTLPERPFVPIGIGDGVDPPAAPGSAEPSSPPAPPDSSHPLDDELRRLQDHDREPVPF